MFRTYSCDSLYICRPCHEENRKERGRPKAAVHVWSAAVCLSVVHAECACNRDHDTAEWCPSSLRGARVGQERSASDSSSRMCSPCRAVPARSWSLLLQRCWTVFGEPWCYLYFPNATRGCRLLWGLDTPTAAASVGWGGPPPLVVVALPSCCPRVGSGHSRGRTALLSAV